MNQHARVLTRYSVATLLAIMILPSASGRAWARLQGGECTPSWATEFNFAGMDGPIRVFLVHDDGSGGGPALFAGGAFEIADGVDADRIAKWNGEAWSEVGGGISGEVNDLVIFDDGAGGGPALYVGGNFVGAGGGTVGGAKYVAKWNGSSWSALKSSPNSAVLAIAVFDDGSGGGPALYAGGTFTHAGGVWVSGIAKWDGNSWSALQGGVDGVVDSLQVFDDGSGSGPALFVGGTFTSVGGGAVAANRIARWNGVSWSALGSGVNAPVLTMTVFDDGSGGGAALFAGGGFTTAGGVAAKSVAKWNGTSWSALAAQPNGTVNELDVLDDGSGSGPALYLGGNFTLIGALPANRIAKWNGSAWSTFGGGMNGAVAALAIFDDGRGAGPKLYAGGSFDKADGVTVRQFAWWDGDSWTNPGYGMSSPIQCLEFADIGAGNDPALYAGGDFTVAGIVGANRIAKWNGAAWSPLGSGVNGTVKCLETFSGGAGGGQALYAGGTFTSAGGATANRIAKWNGNAWSALGAGANNVVNALAVFDNGLGGGPALYAAGNFTTMGGIAANRIAKWNGTAWSSIGSINGEVTALAVYDDGLGGGPKLYAAGFFTMAGSSFTLRIAKWNGTAWSGLGPGINGPVLTLGVFDDGSGAGPALIAGGVFTSAGGVAVSDIAKWNGSSWSSLGSGLFGGVLALAVFDEGAGAGPELFAGGNFRITGGGEYDYIARWSGSSWSPFHGGTDEGVFALAVLDESFTEGPALALGGNFTLAGDIASSHFAEWRGCPVEPPCAPADFNCDGLVDGDDLGTLLGEWGACGGCSSDLDEDGDVDDDDLGVLLAAWGDVGIGSTPSTPK